MCFRQCLRGRSIDLLGRMILKAISGKDLKSILHYFTVISARALSYLLTKSSLLYRDRCINLINLCILCLVMVSEIGCAL